ncbi:MAG TPA: GntG family PLP-dependent aldolase, partial [Candidatus Binatus sp.]|nr:GntG family PLP-dependent aldolase [Candidatus Binatus sp.]
VASGSMGNLVAEMAHLERGMELIAGEQSHPVLHEAASHAVVVGASIRTLRERPAGTLDLHEIEAAFRDPADVHDPITGLVAIENSNANSMGQPLTPAYTAEAAALAHRHGVPLYVDGARFWNAVVALGVTGRELAAAADTMSFCLSKGLACPVGSVVVGSKATIWRARRARKLVGGGMRQVGVLAAPGLVALRDGSAGMIERLAEDHANARLLAEGLGELTAIESPGDIAQPEQGPLDPGRVRTNFVLFRVARDRAAFLEALAARGVAMIAFPHGQIRAVTHYGIGRREIEATIVAAKAALAETSARPVAA